MGSFDGRSQVILTEGEWTHNPPLRKERPKYHASSAHGSDTAGSEPGGMVPDRK